MGRGPDCQCTWKTKIFRVDLAPDLRMIDIFVLTSWYLDTMQPAQNGAL